MGRMMVYLFCYETQSQMSGGSKFRILRAALEGSTLPSPVGVCPPPGPAPVSGVSDCRWGVSAGDSGGESASSEPQTDRMMPEVESFCL